MVFQTAQITRLKPALAWLKRAAVYPVDDQSLGPLVRSTGELRALRDEPYQEEEEVLTAWQASPSTFLEAQQVEFTRLFVNRFGGVPVQPYASYYLDAGTLLGDSTAWVMSMYTRGGLSWSHVPGAETPDHLAVELEFLQCLCGQFSEPGTSANGSSPEPLWSEFWQAHLGRWLPLFATRLGEWSTSPLYRLLAKALRDLCEKETTHE
jgi:TorA maturation chaperone TorD